LDGSSYAQLARLDGFVANGFPYDPNLSNKNSNHNLSSPFGGLMIGSHALLNGNFSPSTPLPGVKLKLPSSQHAEFVHTTGTRLVTVNTPANNNSYTLSPPVPSTHGDGFSPHNSGLLEALLHESQAMGAGGNNRSSEMITQVPPISSRCNLTNCVVASQSETECGEYSNPITPLYGPSADVLEALYLYNEFLEKRLHRTLSMPQQNEMGSRDSCAHYKRRCRIRVSCCYEIYDCRHCHNEATSHLQDPMQRHELPRYKVERVICSICDTEQNVKQVCENCSVKMGNISVQSANSLMTISQRNNIIVMIVAYAG